MANDETQPLVQRSDLEPSLQTYLDDTTPKRPYPLNKILPALWIGSFVCAMDSTIVANIMNGIASDFGQADQASWIATSFLLTNTAFQPLYGKLSDIFGRKHTLMFAQFWFALGCLLCYFSNSVFQFAVARAIAGIGGGGITSLSAIIVGDVVSLNERGIFQGYANISYGIGLSIGGPIGGFCLDTIGWKWMFLLQVPVILFCMMLTQNNLNLNIAHIPKDNERFTKKNLSRIDFGGSFCLVTTISALLFLLSVRMSKFVTIIAGVIFICGALSFALIEVYVAKEPIAPPNIIKGTLGVAALVAGFGTMVSYTSMFIAPIYVQVVQNYTPTGSGGFTIFSVISSSLGSYVTGKFLNSKQKDLSPRYMESRALLSLCIGVGLELVGLMIFALIVKVVPHDSESFSWKAILATGLVSVGFGLGVFLVSLIILVVSTIDKPDQASAIGMNYLFRATGSVLGVAISLAAYNFVLNSKLEHYLLEEGKVEKGQEIYNHLMKDVSYLRNKSLKTSVKDDLINIYKFSLNGSLVPGLIFGVLAVIFSTYALLKSSKASVANRNNN